jgi:excisionase family DNA binding protein
MNNFFTTRELQTMLQVDRTTIYRMADAGRIPALKVGNQWRFPRLAVERWLAADAADAPDSSVAGKAVRPDIRTLFPLECVQQIQDLMADALGVMVLVADLDGRPITAPSHPCGLYLALDATPVAQRRCVELWARMGQAPSLHPTWVESDAGLLLARGLIRVGSELGAMLIAGGVAPAEWPPSEAKLDALAQQLEIDRGLLDRHIHEVFHLDEQEQARVLGFVQRMADVVAHILSERRVLFSKLADIAALTRLEPA